MSNTKLVCDSRKYAVVQDGKLLYLTKNGHGFYTVMNIDEKEEQREKTEKYDRL